ncbi:hypothetical protein JTE90_005059 [Oedothorax gibbosus]|uniref:15-hydroxyprostaglandin dehydrogenase [NAD(+)] n=1 Tax=Oedothorax gibbosus TaxID=931172 RepID=A0AAV6VCK6_9ARAC|nr:hypothetical protein JTE90_005059 [Oedothorax gibbosus]
MDFSGKVAIVTGGSQGIGLAFTSALLDHGMKVCICDIKSEPSEDYIKKLSEEKKSNLMFQKCDVTSFSDFNDAFEKVVAHFGRIDVVVNNAGIFIESDWKKMIEVNFIGVIHGIKLAFQFMNANNGGHGGIVINTGSNTSFEPLELGPVYSGCKHGVLGLTRSYGTDYHFAKTGVKVMAVCPGPVDTNLLHTYADFSIDRERAKEQLKEIKPIKPDAVAQALIEILQKGENGSLMRVDDQGMRFV